MANENTAKSTVKTAEPDDGLTQSERFMQAARQLECDDDLERFKERVKKLAKVSSHPIKPKEQDAADNEVSDDN